MPASKVPPYYSDDQGQHWTHLKAAGNQMNGCGTGGKLAFDRAGA
jgi:hypothetical protein